MGQTAFESTYNELKHALLLPFFFFAGQIIYDIGVLCRIAGGRQTPLIY